jgi:protocatechuate 3,4-dioxygenase beta subunit
MKRRELLLQGSAFLCMSAAVSSREPILGGPCEGCELVFADMPRELTSRARIAPVTQPGAPLVIEGTVLTPAGKSAAGVIVYAYHTDNGGLYPSAATRHGKLRGWAITDGAGRYRFDTIRPAAYPSGEIPEHVHMHVIEPGKGTYWIDDLRFEDDPLNSGHRPTAERGGKGLVMPQRRDGLWYARREIVLGRNI